MSPDAAARSARRARLVLATGALLATVCLLWPVLPDPAGLALGAPDSEAPQQLWLTTAWMRDLWATGPWLRDPHPFRLDPVLMNVRPATVVAGWPLFAALGGGLAAATLTWNA